MVSTRRMAAFDTANNEAVEAGVDAAQVSQRKAPARREPFEMTQEVALLGGVITTWPSFTGSVGPGLNEVRAVPSLPSRR